jgi:hypothetical protein
MIWPKGFHFADVRRTHAAASPHLSGEISEQPRGEGPTGTGWRGALVRCQVVGED